MQLQGEESKVVEALRRCDLDAAALDPAHRGLLKLVETVTLHAYRVNPEQLDEMRRLGWNDKQIAEAVFIAGLFALFNRVADAFGLQDPGYLEIAARGGSAPRPAERFTKG